MFFGALGQIILVILCLLPFGVAVACLDERQREKTGRPYRDTVAEQLWPR